MPDVKLRLGRVSDLVAGDEDLREGVVAAQELGVHLTPWGLGRPDNQARTLVAEADRALALDDVADLFTSAPGSQLALTRQPPASTSTDEKQVRNTAAAFAGTWAARATREELGELLATRPAIPAAPDAELLRAVQAVHGNLRGRDALRRGPRWVLGRDQPPGLPVTGAPGLTGRDDDADRLPS